MYSKKVENAVLEHIEKLRPDAAFFGSSRMGILQKRMPGEITQMLFMQNMELDFLKKQIYSTDPLRFLLYPAVKRNEALAVRNADVIISLNKRDAEKLKEYYGRTTDMILPITLDDRFAQFDESKKNIKRSVLQLLFVGSLFSSNEHGVTWFINEVMPHVNAEFTIVGKNFEKLSDKLGRNNVKVIGTVDDLSEYYYNADAIVSPILFGDGMKVKIAEALMYGKPMFATDDALEGYEAEGQSNITRCNSSQEFIFAINSYASNSPYEPYDQNIRVLFLEKYNTPRYIPILRDLIDRNCSEKGV